MGADTEPTLNMSATSFHCRIVATGLRVPNCVRQNYALMRASLRNGTGVLVRHR